MRLAFALLDQQCVRSQSVLEVKIVPLQFESNWKGVKLQILDYGF